MLRIYDHYIDIIYEYFNISEIFARHTQQIHIHTTYIYIKHNIFKGNANTNLNKNLL